MAISPRTYGDMTVEQWERLKDYIRIAPLSRLEAFRPTDIDRLRPYITFD